MRNLEAKFRLADLSRPRAIAETIGFVCHGTFAQHDTFFDVPHGRLKLREEASGARLIHYHRTASGELELSNYAITPVADAASTRAMLGAAIGVLAEVRKRRTLLLRRNIRLHLDEVETLGVFAEIEAVLNETEEAATYHEEVLKILAALDIAPSKLIEVSYFELMRAPRV